MLRSMTGFGRYESETPERRISVEIKSVNHRYCEISAKMPKKMNFFESAIRNLIKQYASRGKIDVFINYEDFTENTKCLNYSEDILKEYLEAIGQISEKFCLENDIKLSQLLRFPEIFTFEDKSLDEEELWSLIEPVIRKACEAFVNSKIKEGEHLKNDLFEKLDLLLTYVDYIESRSPEVIDAYRQRIIDKVNELLGDRKVDDAVLATELIVYSDKICVDEETVRLRAHIQNMRDTLNLDENIGRKLDFIAQEMNREANTILSKSNDLALSNKAIDLKTEIEKIREQIQNIE